MRGMRPVRNLLLGILAFGVCVGPVAASSGGIAGFSGNPASGQGGNICSQCHSGGIVPTVVIAGPSEVLPGSTNRYLLRISGGQGMGLGAEGGMDVSAEDGTLLATDPGTQIVNFLGVDDVVHIAPRGASLGVVTFSFDWQAPLLPGIYNLYGAGNSVDGNNNFNGDAPAADILAVTVASMSANAPGESSGPALSPLMVTGYNQVSGELQLNYDSACGTDDNNLYFGPLDQVDIAGWTGETCDIGTGGTFNTFDPGSGSVFFVIVGGSGTDDGSYGKDSDGTERLSYVGNACGNVQSLDPACVEP